MKIKSLNSDLPRREFLTRAAFALAAGAALPAALGADEDHSAAGERPLIVSTWDFGKAANDAALKVLLGGGTLLDAVEQGIWVTESAGLSTVGLSGTPNAAGVVQLDACIMSGLGHTAGSVAALEGIRHPISAARRVMEKTPHVMLVGEGARLFALEEGLESIETNATEHYAAWQSQRAKLKAAAKDPKATPRNHDTVALLVLGADGNLAGGCSTSGLGHKLPGRVGDSPIIGSGLYVDNEVGAAGATGLGENVMRFCGSFLVVEYMRQGLHPQAACQAAIRRIVKQERPGKQLSLNFVALDKQGRHGAATSESEFPYSVTSKTDSRVHPGARI
jgi:isoaspartyl peptidase/L-asparaginase-like protein (Ntn-hydrolase superfamily)